MNFLNNNKITKKTIFLLLTILAVLMLTCSFSFAEDGGEMYKNFFIKIFNLSIFVFIIVYFVKTPLKNFLAARKKGIEDAIKGADDTLKVAIKEYQDSEAKLKKLSEEIKQLTENLEQESAREKEKIIKRTEEVIEKLKHQTESSIKREFEIVRKRIKEETIENTINSAEAILQDKFKAEDQDKIAEMITTEISGIKNINAFLQNPISSELKKKVPMDLDKTKQVTETTMEFIKILLAADNTKQKNLSDIKKAYDKYVSDITGTTKAQIYVATELKESTLNNITANIKKAVGKDIEVEVIKDPSIIGGIVTKVGSLVFDASIKTQLENMKENLKNEVV